MADDGITNDMAASTPSTTDGITTNNGGSTILGDGLETPPEGQTPAPAEGTQAPIDPNSYEVNLPEGMEMDPAEMGEFKTMAAGLGLTQPQVHALAEYAAKKGMIGGALASQEELNKEIVKQRENWEKQIHEDMEYGGANINLTRTQVLRAISHLGGNDLREALTKDTGAISHPVVWRAFVRMGRMLGEDGFVSGRTAAPMGGGRSVVEQAKSVYPSMKS
jgi:hypothetical protein